MRRQAGCPTREVRLARLDPGAPVEVGCAIQHAVHLGLEVETRTEMAWQVDAAVERYVVAAAQQLEGDTAQLEVATWLAQVANAE